METGWKAVRTNHTVQDEDEDSAVDHSHKRIHGHDGDVVHGGIVQRPRWVHHKEMAVRHKHRPACFHEQSAWGSVTLWIWGSQRTHPLYQARMLAQRVAETTLAQREQAC